MEVTAPAKINLTLEILGRRSDGFHEIRTVLQTIDLEDRLELGPASTLSVECDAPSLSGESNLVWQAAAALAKRSGVTTGARIVLHKSIPVGMGLGGGSSDAAAALLALNRLWGLDLAMEELAEVAAGIGSDVSFFLWGGTALASGRGEIIQPIPLVPTTTFTLVCPAETLPDKTRQVYSWVTPDSYSDGSRTGSFVSRLQDGTFSTELIANGLEEVCSQVFPGLAAMKELLSVLAGAKPVLSGAGPAMFCLPTTEVEHARIENVLKPRGARVYRVRTTGPRVDSDPV